MERSYLTLKVMPKLEYNCKVKLRISNGEGTTCNIITYIRNRYHTYDLYDYVSYSDMRITESQCRRVKHAFGGLEGYLYYTRKQIVRIYN